MKRLFALMIVVAFTFSMVSFAQDAPKAAKTPKAKVEVNEKAAKKEVAVKKAEAKPVVAKEAKPAVAKVAKHKAKKAAKKAEAPKKIK